MKCHTIPFKYHKIQYNTMPGDVLGKMLMRAEGDPKGVTINLSASSSLNFVFVPNKSFCYFFEYPRPLISSKSFRYYFECDGICCQLFLQIASPNSS